MADMASASARHTCLKLELPVVDPKTKDTVFVKSSWFPSRFELAISDGLNAWTCHGSSSQIVFRFHFYAWLFPFRVPLFDFLLVDRSVTEAEVRLRAEQWDLSVAEYISLSEQYLGFHQPGSEYGFEDAGNGQRRASHTCYNFPPFMLLFSQVNVYPKKKSIFISWN